MLTLVRQAMVCVVCCAAAAPWCGAQTEGHADGAGAASAMVTSANSASDSSSRASLIDSALTMDSAEPAVGAAAISRPIQPAATMPRSPLSRLALAGSISPLGGQATIAGEVTRSTNLRFGWNFFNLNLNGTDTGVAFQAHLHLRSMQASLDYFPFKKKNFHISPGILFNNQNRASGIGNIPGGDSFSLNSVNYYGSYADPVVGTGGVRFKSTAPMFTFGWGNWVSRKEHTHLTFPFEMGFAYQGTGSVDLHLQGSVCQQDHDVNCAVIATDPDVQANIAGQIRKLDKDLEWFRFYPILSTGVALRF